MNMKKDEKLLSNGIMQCLTWKLIGSKRLNLNDNYEAVYSTGPQSSLVYFRC